MTFKTFQRIIDELAPWLYKIRLYNWGEPLMHNDLYRMIAYATEKNIGTEISSHLNVFEDTDAEKLVESGLELLVVSMDGADPATYTRYRRQRENSEENIPLSRFSSWL
jgi:MoaA/NifB/PqqE/SkfB family radical SAM enzyme